RRCAFTRASSSRTRNGLGMKSAAPSPKERTVASSGGMEEIIRTGRSLNRGSALTRCSNCRPSTRGIMMSSSSRSNCSAVRWSNRCSPPATVSTSYPFSFRIQDRVRDRAWSSSATRIFGAMVIRWSSAYQSLIEVRVHVATAEHRHRWAARPYQPGEQGGNRNRSRWFGHETRLAMEESNGIGNVRFGHLHRHPNHPAEYGKGERPDRPRKQAVGDALGVIQGLGRSGCKGG